MKHRYLTIGAFLMSLSIALGAFGAHGLRSLISEQQLANWKTATEYQSINSLGLLLICILPFNDEKKLINISNLLVAGIICFSGSLYLLSCKELLGVPNIGRYIWFVTPIGGLLMISAWGWTAWLFLKNRS